MKGSRPVALMLKITSYLHTDRYYVTIAEKFEVGVPISGWFRKPACQHTRDYEG